MDNKWAPHVSLPAARTSSQRHRYLGVLATVLAVLPLFPPLAARAAAGPLTPAAGAIVATGLANPRGLAIAPDGTLYVAESGLGGAQPIVDPAFGPSRRGFTGLVERIAPDGIRATVASGLPSTNLAGAEAVGPAGLAIARGQLFVAEGITNKGYAQRPGDAAVLRIAMRTGARSVLANLGAFETAHNPDGFTLESDPYGVAYSGGALWVADGGGNCLYRVDPSTGRFSLATVFGGLPLPYPFANPSRKGASAEDPVPTGVAPAPDGGAYVTLFGGFPFQPGADEVIHVAPSGATTVVARGLTMPISVAAGPDGRLYVATFAAGFDAATSGYYPGTGRVLRLSSDGSAQVVVDGLNLPNGLAFDRSGALYVVVDSDYAPRDGPRGRILRFTGIAPAHPS